MLTNKYKVIYDCDERGELLALLITQNFLMQEMQDEVEKDGFEYPEYVQLKDELNHVYQVNGEK